MTISGTVRGGAGLVGLATVLAILLPGVAAAHVRSTEGTSTVRLVDGGVHYDITLELDLLAKAANLGEPDAGQGVLAADRLLEAQAPRLADYLVPRVSISLDGVGCVGMLGGARAADRQGMTHALVRLVYRCEGSPDGEYRIRYSVFADAGGIVDDHVNVVDYDLAGSAGTFAFDSGHAVLEVGRTGLLSGTLRFVSMGLHHILVGADHILFLAVLLLGAATVRQVIGLATAFTVAHSTTLVLGALGWVAVPTSIVEPLIALSIAYVAAENLLGGASRHRTGVVFAFGLLHGLGFAGALNFTDSFGPRLLGTLLSFNVGIELGQALIVALLFPALLLVRRFAWSSTVHAGATGVVGLLGLLWFTERLVA